ncbi:MAG: cadherin repeat domain-containing protein, partial [Candidatus Gracilibacteria bacterium]|nr:cadherin repeat domain-containing protein [Candidatus Gracilibacteria bacterium]
MKRLKNFKLYSVITFFLLLSIWGYKLLAVDSLSLTYTSIDDSVTAGTSVSTISSTDITGVVTYSLSCSTPGTDDSAFSIGGAGDDELIIGVDPDASTKSQYDICVKATDDNGDYEQNFTLSVIDKTSPEFNSITVTSNNSKSGSFAKVGDTLTFSVNLLNNDTSGVGNNLEFDLGTETGFILNYNQDSSYTSSKTQTYTILAGQSGSIDVKSLTFNDDSGNSINGFSLPYTLSDNIIVDTTKPNITFNNDTTGNPTLSESISIEAIDDYLNESTLYYGFSDDSTCDQTDTYNNFYNSTETFYISDKTYNGKYICAKAEDYAGNINYMISAYPINIVTKIITISNDNVNENTSTGTVIGTFDTANSTGTTFTYTFVVGTGSNDNNSFIINGNELQTNFAPNYEADSSYSIRVQSQDENGDLVETEFTIHINDVNEPITDFVMNGGLLDENTGTGTEAGDFHVFDEDIGDTYTYTFVSGSGGEDNSSFTISGATIITNFDPDYETKDVYNVLIGCTDAGGNYFEKSFTVDVYDNAEAPTDISITNTNIDENMGVGIPVGDFSSTDDDIGETFTYSLVSGTGDNDNSLFDISGATLVTNANLNYESDSSYSIRVRTTDYAGLYFEKEFTITLNNVSEAPTDINLSNSSINENVGIGYTIGALTSIDEDVGDTFTYNLVSGTGDDDNGNFNIIGDDLVTAINPNFEVKSSYKIRVSTTDSNGQTFEKEFTITINDVNEAGEDITITTNSFDENMLTGSIVGDFITVDQDTSDTYTYSLITGTGSDDNALFSISGATLITEFTADYETKDNYTILVKSVDGGGFEVEKQITINVNDVNNAPTDVTLSGSTIFENSFIGTFVGTLIGTDDGENNGILSYSLSCTTPGTDDSKFMIDGDELKTVGAINYETGNPFEVCIQVSDGTLTFDKNINIDVTDINESPYDFKFTQNLFDENTPTGFLVGDLSSMDEDLGDTLTYSFGTGVGSTDNGSFILSGSQLFSNFVGDYETKNIYNVKFKVTDNGGISSELPTTILLSNINEIPTDVTLSKSDIDENIGTGALVGNFTTIDQDLGDNHIYTLETGIGDDDNTAFNIVGNALVTNFVGDYETKDTYNVRIRSTDGAGLYTEREFNITINDVVDYLVDFTLSGSILDENSGTGVVVGDFNSSSVNSGATYTYTLVAGTGSADNSSFSISGATLIAEFDGDYEIKDSYSIRVRSVDNLSVTTEKEFTINILNENEGATNITLSNNSIYEESTGIKFIGNLNSNDPDLNDSYNYELITGIGSDDNDLFMIVGNSLLADFIPDYETKDTYNIRVRGTDSQGLAYEKTFIIYVNDVLENPTDITLTSNTIDEGSLSGSIIGDFGTTGTNSGATYTYTFSGTGANDNTLFVLSGTTLITDFVSNYETQNTYNVIVTATDNYGYIFEKGFTIYVNNLNENPSDIDLDNNTLLENTQTGTIVGNMQTTDEDNGDTYIYSLVSGTGSDDNASFSISGSTLISDMIPDYETQNIYYVRIKSSDNGGLYTEKEFIINILNENNIPTDITLSGSTIDENQVIGTYIGDVTGTDDGEDNGNLSFSMNCLMKGVDDDSFVLSGTTLYSNQVFNYEAKDSYNICIRANDGTNNFDKNFVISVNNLPENPTDITLSGSTLDENLPVGSIVGDLETIGTNTGVTYTYTLVAGTGSDNNASFSITGSTLIAEFTANYETKNSYSIRIKSIDNLGSEVESMLTVLISNVNESPISFDINNSSINENLPVGSTIGDFTTTDIDSGDTHTYSLVSGTGSDDNASFSISGSTLVAEISADYETKNSYTILVRSTDNGGLYTEKVFTIAINDVSEGSSNNAPTDITLSGSSINENLPVGSSIGDFTTTDIDSGDTHTYSLVSGTGSDDNASFSISGSTLVAEISADYETKNSYSVLVRSTDAGGLYTEKVFTIAINNVSEGSSNNAPTDITLSGSSINENLPVGSSIGDFTTTDIDSGDTHTYSLVSGTGSDDNASFSISG